MDYHSELSGKVALVTGGTKGAGKAIAKRLKSAGAQVIVTARRKPEQLEEGLYFISADLSKNGSAKNIAGEVWSAGHFG